MALLLLRFSESPLTNAPFFVPAFQHVLMDIVTRGQPEESEEYESNIVKEGMMLLEQMYSREVELFRAAVDIRLVNDATARDRAAMVEKLLPQLQYLVRWLLAFPLLFFARR